MTKQSPEAESLPLVPSWRWQQGRQRAQGHNRDFAPCQDKGVQAAERYWRWYTRCQDEAARQRLGRSMPSVQQAFDLFCKQGERRAMLEARVLANEPAGEIARKSGLSRGLVGTFESLFFDVRRHLEQRDYIFSQVLSARPRPGQNRAEVDQEWTWKVLGYLGGSCVLDVLLNGQSGLTRPRSVAEAVSFLGADTQAELARQLVLAARSRDPKDPGTLEALLRVRTLLAGGQEGASGPGSWEMHIQALLEEIPWLTGSSAAEKLPRALAEHDEGAAELRSDEVLRLAAGEKVPGLAELKAMRLPPPRPKSEAPPSVQDL